MWVVTFMTLWMNDVVCSTDDVRGNAVGFTTLVT